MSSFSSLLLLLFIAAAPGIVVHATPGIKVLTKADNAHLQYLANQQQECQVVTTRKDRTIGITTLTTEIGTGLQQAAAGHPFTTTTTTENGNNNNNVIRSVCSTLTQTSRRHSDRVRARLPDVSLASASNSPPSRRSAFVFLESNPHAYFSYDDQYSVPVEQGNMVVFDGRVPHQTIIEQGTVQLLGPFDAETFSMVGTIPGTDIDIPDIDIPDIGIPDLGDISDTTGLFGGVTLPTVDLTTSPNWFIAFIVLVIAGIAGAITAVLVSL